MFQKILIANRGEIACRVMAAAQRLGIRCVAVYSEADRRALHVERADEAVCIGPAPARESYLRGDKIIAAALRCGAEAVHPGYGFLSENAEFAAACAAAGLVFIGPSPAAIAAMGSKSAAKRLLEQAGVPLTPGYHGECQDDATLARAAADIGYPVLLKAAAGGGGKGMRVVTEAREFSGALASARREAESSFGDGTMLVEKYLTRPRHVEIQLFRDRQGNGVYLFERDCSIQRRHQKVLEEAPAPGLSQPLRTAMGEAALRVADAIDYTGAGTVEFLLDADGHFYFMEMNTRLQVEHPVTEMITGEDLVEWQLRVAAGEPLPRRQEEVRCSGHALEARIYAEDPDQDFLPATGTLTYLRMPTATSAIRVDTGVCQGDEVTIYYDPMLAKLIVHADSRKAALAAMERALAETRVAGVATNIDYLRAIVASEAFQKADIDTGFIGRHAGLLSRCDKSFDGAEALVIAACYALALLRCERRERANADGDDRSPWSRLFGWRLNAPAAVNLCLADWRGGHAILATAQDDGWSLEIGGAQYRVDSKLVDDRLTTVIDGHRRQCFVARLDCRLVLFLPAGAYGVDWLRPDAQEFSVDQAGSSLNAPMPGAVVTWLVEPGQTVQRGDGLLILEAMKIEHTIKAPEDGCVIEFLFAAGDQVSRGVELLRFESAGAA